MEKIILGLDLGTNSVGWALVKQDFEKKDGKILGMGSRIIPMSQDILGEFDKGNSVSQTAERTRFRSVRHLHERHILRRARLHRVLHVMNFLPEHYAKQIDFNKYLGQFLEDTEPKLAYNNKEFIFKKSFEEMVKDFKKNQPELLNRKNRNGDTAKIPYDWTIYYLRKKALSEKISKEELSWLVLHFNQKRGYYQLRGEDNEALTAVKEYVVSQKIVKVEKGNKDTKNDKKYWYSITLENGWKYSATFFTEPQWLNTEKEFLVTEELDEDGNIKKNKASKYSPEEKEKRKITPLPTFEEIEVMSKEQQDKIYKKIKVKTEITISNSGKTVGAYIYDTLLQKPNQKVRGKLVRTIERKFYKDELRSILKKQIELQPELFANNLYNDCIRELYRNNEAHQLTLSKRDFVHLFLDDIIFYQRPLKSQKSSIGNCTFEYRTYILRNDNGEKTEQKEYLKTIPKSHPLYQEYRVWQWISNLKIYSKDDNTDVTELFLTSQEDIVRFFDFLMLQREVNHKNILEYFITPRILEKLPTAKPAIIKKEIAREVSHYRWNYVFDDTQEKENDKSKMYPCNTTGYEIRKRLKQVSNVPTDFLTSEVEQQLWHIIYSVTDKSDFEKAIKSFAQKYGLDEISFEDNFKTFPPFKSEYGSYSQKAIKKLLSLMRIGKYWSWKSIDTNTQQRIEKIMTGEVDKEIQLRVREQIQKKALKTKEDFQGLPPWLASYVVYDLPPVDKWRTVQDLAYYLNDFKQHSLRNPIVEQVVTETLRVIKDIWIQYGKGSKDFFNEIHIELGRDMKRTADERKQMTTQAWENENTNLRIKALIIELKENSDGKLNVDNVRPFSPAQQEILKIYEEDILRSQYEIPDDIVKISKLAQPTKIELQRYKLWLEQKYHSPYTGEIIPLNKLFTHEYEIEHIIPQSRYFDDSFNNKVICEAAVNKAKDNQLGMEFIKNHHGEKIVTGLGKTVEIFSEEQYKDFIKERYAKNSSKKNRLLLEDIPERMISRQINDTRYISKFISGILSNIVRAGKNDDGINSKNIIPGNGRITFTLRKDWGLDDVWNELILHRFIRMNELTKTNDYTVRSEKYKKEIPTVPLELSKGFRKKRIDHRHHALDALVIALATRDHVNLLNNQSAKSDTVRYDLQRKLRKFENIEYDNLKTGKRIKREIPKDFLKPWDNFTADAKEELHKIIVSFKQNLRVINKTVNTFERYVDKHGRKIKQQVTQTQGDNWAIRKSLHKDTVSGEVNLLRVKVPKGKIVTATRKAIDTTFTVKSIESITDTGIQKILTNFLKSKNNNTELAFSPEGLMEMNNNIAHYNDGKPHQPIYKVRVSEIGSKFALGQKGNKKSKFVEAAKGTNLFFAIYQDKNGKRSFETIPLNIVIERQKQGLGSVPETNEKGDTLLFHLSPNDLVYVPTEEERVNTNRIDFAHLTKEQVKQIYKMVSSSGSQCFFIRQDIATVIVNKEEFSTMNKMEKSIEGIMIKESCIKLKVDRLGNILKA